MQQETVLPIQAGKRTAIVDILRGWAILGVVIGNYSDYAYFGNPVKLPPHTVSRILEGFNQFFFAAKSWTLLSVLFGYGFAVVMQNMAAKGKNPVGFFARRMFWLFVIAFVNSAFWFGDILKDYAMLGLVLLLFHKASAKTAFRTAIVLLLLLPFINALVAYTFSYDYWTAGFKRILPLYYSHNWLDVFAMNLKATFYLEMILPGYAITVHFMMFACMLFGFGAQRIDFFNRLPEFKKQLKHIFWWGLVLAIIINILMGMAFKFNWPVMKYFKPRYWAVFSTMAMIASGICCLYINGKLKAFFTGLQAMGKMTLTNYMVQNVLAVLLFLNVGLGLFNTQQYWLYFTIAIVVFAIQIPLSIWWLSRYNYGPVEWVWRQLSYGKTLPIKKQAAN